ncbi:MAG: VWA domain-containing protein, partial [Gammaproteobacteria bacterium]
MRTGVLFALLLCWAGFLWPAPARAVAERDVILLLDNSGSMKHNDPQHLEAAAVRDYIQSQSLDTRVGILIFASHARLAVPLTPVTAQTRDGILSALKGLDYSGRWTDTPSAVERALYELRTNGRPDASRSIILITDGIVDTGDEVRDLEKAQWLRESLASEAASVGVRIFGIAFTEKADYLLLQSLAHTTHADYFRAFRPGDLKGALEKIDADLAAVPAQPAQGVAVAGGAGPDESAGQTAGDSVPANPPSRQTPSAGKQPPERIRFVPPQQPGTGTPAGAAADRAPESGGGLWWWIVLVAMATASVFLLWQGGAVTWLAAWRPGNAARTPPEPKAVLYDVDEPSDIKRYEVGGRPVVIGRIAGNDPNAEYVVVEKPTIGRCHATIHRRGQTYWIVDEGSVNGTFVNGKRINGEHPLKHGDRIRVHRHEFEFVIPDLFDTDATM